MKPWSIKVGDPAFIRFLEKLSEPQRAIVSGLINDILVNFGIDICDSHWGKSLGGGLYEFRIRVHSKGKGGDKTLVRVFCTFATGQRVVLLHGYNKLADTSKRRQTLEIRKARKILREWRGSN